MCIRDRCVTEENIGDTATGNNLMFYGGEVVVNDEIVSVESDVAKQVFDEVENNAEDLSGDCSDDDSDESDVEENLPRPTDTVLLSNVQPEPIFLNEEPGATVQNEQREIVAESEENDKDIIVAPAQHGIPKSIFLDKYNEELSFPEIFQGEGRVQPEDREVPVRWADIARAELNNVDRRCATNIANIFYKLRKSQIKNVNGKTAISTRRKRKANSDESPLETHDIITEEKADKMVNLNQGSQIFSNFRLSPAYLNRTKKNVFAMIRQRGKPTFFHSYSVADTKWSFFLVNMFYAKNNYFPSEEQLSKLTWEEKVDILNHDHVLTSQLFHNMVVSLIDSFKKKSCPLGRMTDFFYRIEAQRRGKLHLHIVSYHEGAPKLSKKELLDIIEGKDLTGQANLYKYIDNHITCAWPEENNKEFCLLYTSDAADE